MYQKLKEYEMSGHYGFHMPGHKRNAGLTNVDLPYGIDITEIEGFDDLHHAEGVLKQAQERAAKVFHAEETHFLVNGSTAGILSAVIGSTRRGDKVAVARNCHKSVYNAVFMNGLRPVYLYPEIIEETGINTEITVREVERVLTENPDVRALVITSPTYDGVVSDVKSIARVVHERGIVLIVDEAHGAHFGFHPYFPQNGNQQGADIVIHSLHKTLPALTQTALLHINGAAADRERVRQYLHMLQSSSPSYVLMAGIDECARVLTEIGEGLFERYVCLLDKARERLGSLQNLRLVETERYDRSKLLIAIKHREEINKFTGKELYNLLNEKYLLQMEMAGPGYIVAMTSCADTDEGMERLISAMEEIDRKLANMGAIEGCGEGNASYSRGCRWEFNEQAYLPFQVEEAAEKIGEERISFEECAGRIVLEYAYVYPPGIPLIVPGEKVSVETVRLLKEYEKAGLKIEGTKTPGEITVLKERENSEGTING